MTGPLASLAVTTSDRIDPSLRETAQRAAAELGLPYLPRTHKVPLGALLREQARAVVVFEAGAVSLADAQGTLRFSPGLAHLRIKQLDRGVEEDMLIRHAQISGGDRVLDCTVGLAADAQVAARLAGPTGSVVALEKSPALYLLVRHGLQTLPRHPGSAPIEVLHADAADFLRAQPTASFDVVLFDPMFERTRRSSAAFEALRRHADYSELTAETVEQARRVARRWVVIKGARYSRDLKKLGLAAEPLRRGATLVWARLPARAPVSHGRGLGLG